MSDLYVRWQLEIANGMGPCPFWQCKGCGALVADTKQHDVWHQLQDALFADRESSSTSAASESVESTLTDRDYSKQYVCPNCQRDYDKGEIAVETGTWMTPVAVCPSCNGSLSRRWGDDAPFAPSVDSAEALTERAQVCLLCDRPGQLWDDSGDHYCKNHRPRPHRDHASDEAERYRLALQNVITWLHRDPVSPTEHVRLAYKEAHDALGLSDKAEEVTPGSRMFCGAKVPHLPHDVTGSTATGSYSCHGYQVADSDKAVTERGTPR